MTSEAIEDKTVQTRREQYEKILLAMKSGESKYFYYGSKINMQPMFYVQRMGDLWLYANWAYGVPLMTLIRVMLSHPYELIPAEMNKLVDTSD